MPSIFEIRCMKYLKRPSCFSHGDNFTNSDDFALVFADIKNRLVEIKVYYRGYLLSTVSLESKNTQKTLLCSYIENETVISIELKDSTQDTPPKIIASIEFYSKESYMKCVTLFSKMGAVRRRQAPTLKNDIVDGDREQDSHIENLQPGLETSQLDECVENSLSRQTGGLKRRRLNTTGNEFLIFSQLINLQFSRREALRLKIDHFQRFRSSQIKQQEKAELQLQSLEDDTKLESKFIEQEESHPFPDNEVETSADDIQIGDPINGLTINLESEREELSKPLQSLIRLPGLQIEIHSPIKDGVTSAEKKKDSEFTFLRMSLSLEGKPTHMVSEILSGAQSTLPRITPAMGFAGKEDVLPKMQNQDAINSANKYSNLLTRIRYGEKSIDFESIEKLNSNSL